MNEMIWFGIVDNGILCIVVLAGVLNAGRIRMPWSKDRGVSTTTAALAGAMIGNALSDGAAGLGMGMEATVAVVAGCLIPFIAWPLCTLVIRYAERNTN